MTSQQLQFDRSVDLLASEFAGSFNRATVERLYGDSFQLLRQRHVTLYVVPLSERLTRDRLKALEKIEGRRGGTIPGVLFLCVHNAGRSQMAAGWMRHLAGDGVLVYSAGSEPADALNPDAIDVMREVGIDITDELPKPWTDEVIRAADIVVTMGCGDSCPYVPGARYIDWELDDPAELDLPGVRRVRDEIRARVEALLAELRGPDAGGLAEGAEKHPLPPLS